MKRLLVPIIAVLVVAGFITATLAAGDQIYIRNQLYKGRTAKAGNTVLVHLDDFLSANGLSRAALHLSGPSGGNISGTYRGKPFSVHAEDRPDGLYVAGQALVEGLGGRWDNHPELSMVDVSVPGGTIPGVRAPGPAQTVAAAPPAGDSPAASSGSPAASGTVDPEAEKTPIKITDFEFVDPTQAQANPTSKTNVDTTVKGKVVIKNEAHDYVDGVEITVHIQDGYENDIDTVKKDVDKLDGGAEYTFEWTWINGTRLLINPQVEVQFNKLISKADRDKAAKNHTELPKDDKKVSVKSRATAGLPAASASVGGGVGS